MANKQEKKIEKAEERIGAVEEVFSKSEQFIEKYQKIILIVIGVIVVIVLGFFGFKRFYLAPREKEAQSQMFMAEKYFELDSLNKALNGDGQYLGFLSIIEDYSMTKSANLSHYYAGICFLKMGKYDQALEHLDKFSSDDNIIGPMAKGAMGDAYMELKQVDKAVDLYMDAADMRKNDFTTPLFFMKAAMAYEELGKLDKSLEIYKRIKEEYPRSNEGREIDKYISYTESLLKK
ncbi:MAG: tetratricopeptide repeat protein [Bacteroidales bacterium]|mgnify:CR=1 FL=1|nr:tetratricopeptide repeat protein [Bacteroidales bacterium]HNW73627.1 tetratricopeptide repeat protein [Bacteroidales bacterium]HPS49956.1 tetratricopeptide repeat protein [Bacteroidales bacterium]